MQLKRANLHYEYMFLKALLMNWFPCWVQEIVLQCNEWKALSFKHRFTKNNTTFYTKFSRIRKLRKGSDPVLLYLKMKKIGTLSPLKVNGRGGGCSISGSIDTSVISVTAEVLWLLISF